jgi:four helix bundle protein
MQKIKTFTDIIAWSEAHKLVIQLYQLTVQFPKEEMFGLTSQIRRAAVSITSNIAEGFGRNSFKEKLRFYYISQGSIIEIKNQLLIARDVKMISNEKFNEIDDQINHTHRLLQGFISKTKQFALSSS